MEQLHIKVVEAAGWTAAQIRASAVTLGAEVTFIDYVGLIKAKASSRYELVTQVSVDLHTFAQATGITVFALSQMNREGDSNPDMTCLRESGQLEQDADVGLILFQEDVNDKGGSRTLRIGKNKNGVLGDVPLEFHGATQYFREGRRARE